MKLHIRGKDLLFYLDRAEVDASRGLPARGPVYDENQIELPINGSFRYDTTRLGLVVNTNPGNVCRKPRDAKSVELIIGSVVYNFLMRDGEVSANENTRKIYVYLND
jgi:hypothetical protein